MRPLSALERRPWAVALLGAAGVTLLVPCGLALLAPLPLLDAAVALGDARLAAALGALFAASAAAGRLLAGWRRGLGERGWERSATATEEAPVPPRGYLR